ncbi:hypothetical protein OROHE_002472 [Orobanche hederae]
MDAGFGWILTLSESDGELHLVKPFDYFLANIHIPSNIETFSEYDQDKTYSIQRVFLSANPSETSNFVLLVIVNYRLGFLRNGENHWTSINLDMLIDYGCLGYFKGKMYVVNPNNKIHIWDPSGSAEVILTLDDSTVKYLTQDATAYLVESTVGELLLIMSKNISPDDYIKDETPGFKVMRVDLSKRVCEDVKGVGKDAIFLDHNNTTAVAASDFPGVLKPNCIYFTDENWGKDVGIYIVEDKSIERFHVESLTL